MNKDLHILIDNLVAQVGEDKNWQSNLTDEERKAALNWATKYLRSLTEGAFTDVRQRLRTLNFLMGPSPNFVARDKALQAWLE